jgi:hypothetical protein
MTFYEAIRAKFNASTLSIQHSRTAPFADLYQAGPPLDSRKPYCVLDTDDDAHTSFAFGVEFHTDKFTLTIVSADQETGQLLAAQIRTVFGVRGIEEELSVAGLTVTFLQCENEQNAKIEDDFWTTTLDYMTEYEVTR